MTVEERLSRYPHGELIIPGGHIVLRSMYQFGDSDEVYAFLYGCKKERCSVCFKNEGITVERDGTMNVPDMAIAVYMLMKNNSSMVEDYLRFLMKAARHEWSLDRVEVLDDEEVS